MSLLSPVLRSVCSPGSWLSQRDRIVALGIAAVSLLVLSAATPACLVANGETGADSDPLTDTNEDALAAGYVKASTFNKSGLHHSAGSSGIKVTKTRNDQPITTYDAWHHPIGSVALEDGPNEGNIRIATLEDLFIDGKRLFRVWPGGASHQGWIELDDVRTESAVREEQTARAGNGDSCGSHGAGALTTGAGHAAKYVITPRSIQPTASASTRWKLQSSTGAWYRFNPDWDHPGGVDRVFLMWSWTPTDDDGHNPGFAGGGVVRTEMLAQSEFTPCKVQPIRSVLRETSATSGSEPHADARRLSVSAGLWEGHGPDAELLRLDDCCESRGGRGVPDACRMHGRTGRLPAGSPAEQLPLLM